LVTESENQNLADEMDISTDIRRLCSELNDFGLPRAIGHITEKRLLLWNETFIRQAKLEQEELANAEVELCIDLAQPSDTGGEGGLMPFALKTSATAKMFLGHAVKRADGFLLMMLDITPGDVLLRRFWQGRVLGEEQEKQRMAQVIHDSFSPHLLAAFFLIHGIRERLEKRFPGEAEKLAKVGELINESIQRLAVGFSDSK
jgi:signal transduction histidine kinase